MIFDRKKKILGEFEALEGNNLALNSISNLMFYKKRFVENFDKELEAEEFVQITG